MEKERTKTISETIGVGINLEKLPLFVKHQDLERLSENSPFRSKCPTCKNGLLMMERDFETYKLKNTDRCLLCGQRYVYYDIDNQKSFGIVYKEPINENLLPKKSFLNFISNIFK